MKKSLRKMIQQRNEALLSLDRDKLMQYMLDYGVQSPSEEIVFWAGVHKARTEVLSFTAEVKEESRKWLIANGFKPVLGDY